MDYPKFFTLKEFINSETANANNVDNVPDFEQIVNIYRLCGLVLEPARKQLGRPITVTSGYRCPALNRLVGGVPYSQHMTGCAADLKCDCMSELFDILAENENVDQLLFEDNGQTRWVHVSIPLPDEKPRHQINRNYKAYVK